MCAWIITGSALGGKYVSMDNYRVGLRRIYLLRPTL
jgi:hypothetical protein